MGELYPKTLIDIISTTGCSHSIQIIECSNQDCNYKYYYCIEDECNWDYIEECINERLCYCEV